MVQQVIITLDEDTVQYAEELQMFFDGMVEKLRVNAHKGKWEDMHIGDAVTALQGEFDELIDALEAPDPEAAAEEAMDVANFCLIVANMCMSGTRNPFASSVRRGQAIDFVQWAAKQEEDHCILWPYKSKTGPNQEYGSLSKNAHPMGRRAHRVVCYLAHGEPPSDEHHAEHLCGNSLCVNPHHLNWAAPEQNQQRKREHGTAITPKKLNPKIADDIRLLHDRGLTVPELAKQYGCSMNNIRNIINRRIYVNP